MTKGRLFPQASLAVTYGGLILFHAAVVSAAEPRLYSSQQREASTVFAAEKPKPVLSWGSGDGKSYLIPAADIFGFEFLLNQFNRNFIDRGTYGVGWSSIRKNLNRKWWSTAIPSP